MFTVRWLFYIHGQAPKVLSLTVSSSESGETGKGLGQGGARAWLLVVNQTCSLGHMSMQDFYISVTTDKDLLGHKLLVTNCVVSLGNCIWRFVQCLHAVHSVMHKRRQNQWTFSFSSCYLLLRTVTAFLTRLTKTSFLPAVYPPVPITTKARVAMV